ncbi:MAG: thiamine biosynthesis lipoprotein ApbE [Granulosicoccus sp.]|jgi:thiamine biosynthesis lipoprotein ApbE
MVAGLRMICLISPRVNNEPWPIGIVHPTQTDTPISAIHLLSGSLATSGGYERYFDIEGKRYNHLIDPRTGWPAPLLVRRELKMFTPSSTTTIPSNQESLRRTYW